MIKEISMPRKLTSYEQETIINFNKAEEKAHIFTYEKTWQKHFEGRLGLRPVMDNGFGGKEYELPKSRIKPPRAPRRLSDSAKIKLAERLHGNRVLSAQNLVTVGK
ncbi:hypothetical protein ACFLS8_05035 [Chloroflexota bacterium]